MFFSLFYQHYISPHYPRNCKETFREKYLTIHLRVRDCKPTIIYTNFLSFSLLLLLQFQILEMFLTETLTPNLSIERSLVRVGSIGISHRLADAIWRVAERFFTKYFGFLFDNTSRCYLVFASLFPYSLNFTFIVYSICLCLRELFRFHCVMFTLILHLVK